ncbi:MAG: ATP-grasp domain-containing protein, partial [Acidobacteriaceae bacterium]|nr:ATP-grasp domain-containing protein [Acidobacteriaceae bacterium]
NSPGAVAACRNKFEARQKFAAAGLHVPEFLRVPVDADPEAAAGEASYPCVLKPLGLSGSRGVVRADSAEEFVAAFRRIAKLLASPDIAGQREEQNRFIQVERFIPGREFALEGIVDEGSFRVLALFDKPDPLDGPYFEETIYVTPSREDRSVQRAIEQTAGRAVRALGLRRGPVHAEMRVNVEGVWMLEVAARPIGGLCARVLPGLPKLLIRHALFDDPGELRLDPPSAGVMMIPIPRAGIYEGVRGVEDAKGVAGIQEVIITAKLQQPLIPLPEGSSYLGFIFAEGASPTEVEETLRRAHALLRIDIGVALPVLAR